jgi:hypothetical protein
VLLCRLEGLPDLSIKMVWRKLVIAANGMLPVVIEAATPLPHLFTGD